MGVSYLLKCRKCGHEFVRRYGVGVTGQGTLYCQKCGSSKNVDLSCGWNMLLECSCGGAFSENALGCCPLCGTLLETENITPDTETCWN